MRQPQSILPIRLSIAFQLLNCVKQGVKIGGNNGGGQGGNGGLPPRDAVIRGTEGNDRLSGLARNEQILGLSGNDILFGGHGDDTLMGGDGKDSLHGGNGQDLLFSGTGNDTVMGAAGRDVFALERGIGRDVIRDFRDRQDKLGLTNGMTFRQLTLTQQGNNLLISFRNDQLAVLMGVNRNQITAADFQSVALG